MSSIDTLTNNVDMMKSHPLADPSLGQASESSIQLDPISGQYYSSPSPNGRRKELGQGKEPDQFQAKDQELNKDDEYADNADADAAEAEACE